MNVNEIVADRAYCRYITLSWASDERMMCAVIQCAILTRAREWDSELRAREVGAGT